MNKADELAKLRCSDLTNHSLIQVLLTRAVNKTTESVSKQVMNIIAEEMDDIRDDFKMDFVEGSFRYDKLIEDLRNNKLPGE